MRRGVIAHGRFADVGVDDGVAVAEGVGEETGVGVTDGVGVAVANGDAVAVEVAVADGAGSAPLSQMGARIRSAAGGLPPLEIEGNGLKSIRYELPVASAQVKMGLPRGATGIVND